MTAIPDNTQQTTAKSSGVSLRYELIASGIPADTVDNFITYHKANPEIWKHFERYALTVIGKGKKIGAKGIYERVRWDLEIESEGEFKLNNNYAAYYARAFELKHPQYKGFFEFRTITGLNGNDTQRNQNKDTAYAA